jgi:hypothetical protein
MHGGMMAGMGLWMLFWGLFLLVVLVLAVLGIVALVRHLSTPTTPGARTWRQPGDTSRPPPSDRTPP